MSDESGDNAMFACCGVFFGIGFLELISVILCALLTCPDGTFDDSIWVGGCKTCPDRQWRALGGWWMWSFGMASDSECYDCKSNSVSNDHTECHMCPPGKFANYGCDDCPSGRYQESESLDKCLVCEDGTMPSKDSTTCAACYTMFDDYDSNCVKCPEGKHPSS